ncbi:hypothetical protein AB0E01_07635, partial [Nocardia vinacea]|uniref:hypothetical protein n=1 Tax=Nocardia vinacea TaxID=96468 RepID=UPI0033E20CCF
GRSVGLSRRTAVYRVASLRALRVSRRLRPLARVVEVGRTGCRAPDRSRGDVRAAQRGVIGDKRDLATAQGRMGTCSHRTL